MLNDTGVSAAVVVTTEKVSNVVEITLHARGERFLHAVAKAPTWETATTDAVAKILHQAEKVKNKWQERSGAGRRRDRSRRRAASRRVGGGKPTAVGVRHSEAAPRVQARKT